MASRIFLERLLSGVRRRDFTLHGDEFPLLDEELADHIAVLAQNLAHDTRPVILQGGDVRQIRREHPVEHTDPDGCGKQTQETQCHDIPEIPSSGPHAIPEATLSGVFREKQGKIIKCLSLSTSFMKINVPPRRVAAEISVFSFVTKGLHA
jgi:hypothetical protein